MSQDIFFQETLTQGITTIFLKSGGYRGRCYYSDKIAHGLGEGTVQLSFAVLDEAGYDNGPLNGSHLIFGDLSAFEESSYLPGVPAVKIGAVLFPEQGQFQIGIRLQENTPLSQLKIAWWASRLEPKTRPAVILPDTVLDEPDELLSQPDENAFFITNAPRVLRTGKQFSFHVAMPKAGGTPVWTVKEPGGGTITQEGVYTAPSVPGIFEIQASLGEQITSVYIMVKE
ncbi:MAG: hypothetical protein IJ315_02495 [Firmicutes bacterium]|nr:hypothetical protein [Bacillota bacterium]